MLLLTANVYSQNKQYLDSLFQVISKTNDIKIQADCYNLIANEYKTNAAFDSISLYANKSLILSQQINYNIGIGSSYSNLAAIEYDKGNNNNAIELYNNSLEYFKLAKSDLMIARSYTSIGNIHIITGNYKKALETYLNSDKIIEKILEKDSTSINIIQSKANNLNNIGNVYYYLNNFDEVLNYYFKAKSLYEKINDKLNLASSFNNIGLIYRVKGETDKSINFRLKAIDIFKEINNIEGLAYSNLGIGNLYREKKLFKESFNFYNEALRYYEQMDSKRGIIMIYINFSEIFVQNNEFEKSLSYLDKALELSFQINDQDLRKEIYKTYSDVYKSMENYKLSLEYQALFINLKDSIFTTENQKIITEMQTKYETEKKDQEIKLKNLVIDKKEAENKKQKILIFSFLIGFVIILIFSILLYRLFILKKKANILLAQKNIEVEQKNEEITAQRDEIEAQRNEVQKHRDLVVHQKEEIESSITYAQRIQNAVLPTVEHLNMFLSDYFILFRPKDIVSGDFYWATIIKNWQILTVADCTGHGVPGAFMSMLGVSFLNEIIRKQEVTKASDVLNHLRKSVVEALKQTGESGTQKDGMDMSFAVINIETNQLQWAGANNPLWIIKSPKFQIQNSKPQDETSLNLGLEACFLELKADKMPIAIYERMDDFTNHELQLNSGDILYIMSDGYEDQFGGSKGKKFLSKNLKQLLIANCKLPMIEQKQILEKTLVEWIGDGEQIDDITVLGIRI